ncbi:hypothetical protein GON26_13835 [Flavobacterium sp. GA093]|uniref:Uncharacterized protein n=1 Tax=Flavobacterium hydrocarbonoxydans TaxID=2683249 RepID=A0A6I4NM32_9FLAO|nr:hypothetical protein [Flavobacterium hydrocarbonoxydans]MWB95446.1 hypothetical protein [Flavobacterium hydrocarbonoxydans]
MRIKKITLIIFTMIISLMCSSHKKNIIFTDDFNFIQIYEELKISKTIKLVRFQEDDYFSAHLYKCKTSFYKDIIKKRTYYLHENKAINNIIVTEYLFKDSVAANQSFNIVNEYVTFLRNLERKDYSKKCYEIWDEQPYFVTQMQNHIYIYTILDDLKFDKNNNSIETIINNSKEILLDDLYNEFDSKCKILD